MQVSREFRGSRPRRSWGFEVGAVAAKRRLSRNGVRLHGGCELNDDKESEPRRADVVVRRVAGENRSGRGGAFRAGACSCSLACVQAIHRTGACGERGAREFLAGWDRGYGCGRRGAAPPAVVGCLRSGAVLVASGTPCSQNAVVVPEAIDERRPAAAVGRRRRRCRGRGSGGSGRRVFVRGGWPRRRQRCRRGTVRRRRP
jgi:hypothetical protein